MSRPLVRDVSTSRPWCLDLSSVMSRPLVCDVSTTHPWCLDHSSVMSRPLVRDVSTTRLWRLDHSSVIQVMPIGWPCGINNVCMYMITMITKKRSYKCGWLLRRKHFFWMYWMSFWCICAWHMFLLIISGIILFSSKHLYINIGITYTLFFRHKMLPCYSMVISSKHIHDNMFPNLKICQRYYIT